MQGFGRLKLHWQTSFDLLLQLLDLLRFGILQSSLQVPALAAD